MAARHDPTSSRPFLVAFEADKNKIMNALLDTSERRTSIVAIVGPRGVGKTYLAKEIYTSAMVEKHFNVRIWLSAAHKNLNKVEALKCMMKQIPYEELAKRRIKRKHTNRIGTLMLYEKLRIYDDEAATINFLLAKRYCVVIDDLQWGHNWQDEAWSILPNKSDGSRIIVTTRPEYGEWRGPIPISVQHHDVGPRSNKESLQILLMASYPKYPWEGCPAGEVGDLVVKFVRKCEGMPWPLRFLGHVLSERPWNEVLGRIQDIEAAGISFVKFAMSYRDLPNHKEREAFLYFLTFREDAEIHAMTLVHMLVAEHIASSILDGKDILQLLAKRSMIEVTKWYSDDSIKCCRLHDPFLRFLAILEAKEKGFVWQAYSDNLDLFDAPENFPSYKSKKSQKFGRKSMDLADSSCIFNFGENFPLETASDRVLDFDYSKAKVDVGREAKKRRELQYLRLNNLRSNQDIKALVVIDRTIETLSSKELVEMRSLEYLSLRNTEVREIPLIPMSLKTLDVQATPLEILPELIGSSSLTCLLLRNTKVHKITQLPMFLKTLDVSGTPIEALPDSSSCLYLTTLLVRNTKVHEIPETYKNLRHLDVRDTFVRSLPYSLWNNRSLRSILASDTLQHLDGPPSRASLKLLETLETVHVSNNWGKQLPKFDTYRLKKLGLSYFPNAFTPDNALNWDVTTRLLSTLRSLSSLKIQGSNVPAKIIDVMTCPSYKNRLKILWVGGSYSQFSLSGIEMPPQLITLTLENLEFDQDPMPILGKLGHLKTLQLRWLLYNAQTKKMICSNGEFPQLEKLQLNHISGLEEWSVEEGALPKITHVVIDCCKALENLSGPLVDSTTPLKELHLHAMPPGLTTKFSHLPFVKINEI